MRDDISVRLAKIKKYAANRHAGQRWSQEIEAEVRSLRELGVSVAQLADETGISAALIYKWLSPRRSNRRKPRPSVRSIKGDIKVIEVLPRSLSFHLRWRHLEVRFH